MRSKRIAESIIAEKDVRVRELEMKATKNSKRVEHLEPELEKMEEKYSREKIALARSSASLRSWTTTSGWP